MEEQPYGKTYTRRACTHGGNIHMEGYTQRDIHTEGHIRWYIHMMGPTYGGDIHTEGYIH